MSKRRAVINSIADVEDIRSQVLSRAASTSDYLRNFVGEPFELLRALRFQKNGRDPLTGEPSNVIEQLNQTFTILVSLRAVERLLQLHPNAGGFRLALATSSGRDIESLTPDLVAAEVFAATHPGSNKKLQKDTGRLAKDLSRFRYVFFAAPGYASGRHGILETTPGVEVHCVEV